MKHIRCGHAAGLLLGLASVGAAQAADTPIGAPQDWSSRAVVHRQPMTPDEFNAAGRGAQLQAAYRDPRYVASVLRRIENEAALAAKSTASRDRRDRRRPTPPPPPAASGTLLRDWSNVLGGGTNGMGGRGAQGIFPAKYTFNIFDPPSCTDDFVVYPTNAGGASQSGVLETWVASFSGDPGNGSTITIGLAGVRQVVLTASNSVNTGQNFQTNGDDASRASNLRDAINRWTSQTGYRATSSGAQVTIIADVTGNIPDSAISEALSNFAGNNGWGGVNGSGSPGQPTIIAFNQLYQGAGACSGAWNNFGAIKAPNVAWAYNTGTGYVAETSPVLSYLDGGKQVAFVQRNNNTLQLVLLKWRNGEGTAAVPATSLTLSPSAAAYRACSSNCYFAITFDGISNTGGTPTFSSPFVDYSGDVLWAGDGNGRLHKFTGVFQGSPAEVIGGGFPATVEAGRKLSPPVFAGNSVYVGSQSGGAGVGGKLHRVNAGTGAVASSIKLANDDTVGLRESPIVDNFTGSVFAFLFNDGTAGDGSTCTITANNPNACRVVARFATGFADGASPVQRAYVGRGNSAVSTLYAGGFDDAYYNSVDASGAMYIVGGDVVDTFVPTLWKIPLTAGVMGAPQKGPVVGSNNCNQVGDCLTNNWDWSPVTVIKNGTAEYLYFSMGKKGNLPGCTGACLYMFNLADLNGATPGTGAAWDPSNVPSAALATPGGTGGIIVDNVRPEAGASQVYFSHTGTTGNAIQASQSALD